MTVLMLLWNYIITPLYMHTARADVAAMLVPCSCRSTCSRAA